MGSRRNISFKTIGGKLVSIDKNKENNYVLYSGLNQSLKGNNINVGGKKLSTQNISNKQVNYILSMGKQKKILLGKDFVKLMKDKRNYISNTLKTDIKRDILNDFDKKLIDNIANNTRVEVLGLLGHIARQNNERSANLRKLKAMVFSSIILIGGVFLVNNMGIGNKETSSFSETQETQVGQVKTAQNTDNLVALASSEKAETPPVKIETASVKVLPQKQVKQSQKQKELNTAKTKVKDNANKTDKIVQEVKNTGYSKVDEMEIQFGENADIILTSDAYKSPMPWSEANGKSIYQLQEDWAIKRAKVVMNTFNEKGVYKVPLNKRQKNISEKVSTLLVRNFQNKVNEKLNATATEKQINDYKAVIDTIIWYADSRGDDPYKWLAILAQESGWGVSHIKFNYFGYGKTDSQDLGYQFNNKLEGAIAMMEIISNTKYWKMDIKTMTDMGNWNFTDPNWYGSVASRMWQLKNE